MAHQNLVFNVLGMYAEPNFGFWVLPIFVLKGRECTQKLMTSHPMQSNGAEKEKCG